MVMLSRFVPWRVRDPQFHVAAPERGRPLARAGLAFRALLAVMAAGAMGILALGALSATSSYRGSKTFDLTGGIRAVLHPVSQADWISLASLGVFALLAGLATAATLVARRGVLSGPEGN
jgi:hypothetical protein